MSVTADRPLALVTGASSGIGFELAKVFAENGFDLIVAAENPEIRQAGEELRRAGAQATVHVVKYVLADMVKPHRGQAEPGSATGS